MAAELRKTGIDFIGDVPWGTHFCHFYETKDDLLDILIPYFKTGLENNEFCMWVVFPPRIEEEAMEALRSAIPNVDRHVAAGDIEILPHTRWYLKDGIFDPQRVSDGWQKKLTQALSRGYDGMRVNGNEAWLKEKDWNDFSAYEKRLNELIANRRMIALCTYPLATTTAGEFLDVARTHEFAIARRQGNWEVLETPEQKQAKVELTRLTEELERRVAERTRELAATNEELVRKIIESKRAEEALRESAATLAEAQRAAKIGNWCFNLRTNKVTWSDELYRIFEIEKPDFDGRYESFVSRIHPDDQPLVLQTNARTRIDGSPFNMEYRIITPDGKVKMIREVGYTNQDNAGNVIRLFGTAQDITDRKKAEDELRESERKYRDLVDGAPVGIFQSTIDGRVIGVNPAYAKMFGYASAEEAALEIDNVAERMYVEPERRKKLIDLALRTGGFVKAENQYRKKDGSLFWGQLYFQVVRYRDGEVKHIGGFVEDISDRKILEQQLLQAQKMEAIGTLAGGIAHDFNNLLQVILGYSELLLVDKREDDPEYADLSKILESARSGSELVRRLLTFSRKVESKPVPLNLNRSVDQAERFLRRTISKMIEIQLDLSGDLAEINADPTQMEQVLMNLAVNARDAMPDGGKLTVGTRNVTLDEEYCRIHAETRPGEYVLLTVSDTGHGIDKETIDHIFEPFFTTKELGCGTGLGLAVVYGIVKQHGGFINCYSEVEHGTTFNVYFPAIESPIEPEVQSSGVMPAFGTETILIVDDEDLVRELGARILSKAGYNVLTATNSREALDLFEKERAQISLVILDLIMPKMGGKECLKELRKIDPQLKVLIASGLSDAASVQESIKMGAKGFIYKPFKSKELLRQVRGVLDEVWTV